MIAMIDMSWYTKNKAKTKTKTKLTRVDGLWVLLLDSVLIHILLYHGQ